MPTVYKYRSLDNWKFVLDALVNGRLYAATFDTLNDPMEGRYFSFGRGVTKEYERAIYESKKGRRIVSLSKEFNNTLLWAYYGGGHRGVSLGIELPLAGRSVEVRDVVYDNGVSVRGSARKRDADAAALDILTQKQLAWEHEREVRVFTDKPYVSVSIVELVLGFLINPDDEQLLIAVARQWHPGITITKIKEKMLDMTPFRPRRPEKFITPR